VTALNGKKATFDALYTVLKQQRSHILHFTGHARFREDNPSLSGRMLHDKDMARAIS
jgi:CHAT domain-containing protein